MLSSIIAWIFVVITMIPLLPLFLLTLALEVICIPILFVVITIMSACGCAESTINLVIKTTSDVCTAPYKLFRYALMGVAGCFPEEAE